MADDGRIKTPSELHSYITRVLHYHRSQVQPLYNTILVAGFSKGEAYLGYSDLYGSSYKDNVAASGFGNHLALPILRKKWRADLTEQEARSILEECVRVLYYRDARSLNRFTIGKATSSGIEISEPFSLQTNWEFQRFVHPQQTALSS